MPRFVLGFRTSTQRIFVRIAVRPVDATTESAVDRVVGPDEVPALIEAIEEDCAPPWCVVCTLEAPTLAEAERRAWDWHFT